MGPFLKSAYKCEQYLELPRAIATVEGMPQKGDKAVDGHCLQKDMTSTAVSLCIGHQKQSSLMGCLWFMPTQLLARYVTSHVQAGASEIHIVFDNPGQILCFPKCTEQ